jgi:hypothetical protein
MRVSASSLHTEIYRLAQLLRRELGLAAKIER